MPGFPAERGRRGDGGGIRRLLRVGDVGRVRPRAGFEGCFDEWDAFASGFGDCLRRVDWGLRLGEVLAGLRRMPTDEHCRGEVWSGALWTIRGALGGAVADRLVIQSHFSLTPTASFDQAARALLAADSALYGGVHRPLLKAVLGRARARGRRAPGRHAGGRDVPLALPGRAERRLSAGADAHDVYALKLTARPPGGAPAARRRGRTTTCACWRPAPPA